MRDERGFILLTALLALLVLALLGARMVSLARTSTQTIALSRDSAVAEAAADGAVDSAVFELLRSAAVRRAPPFDYDIDLPGARVHITCRELSGRINPNLASPRLFRALLLVLGVDDTTAGRVTAALLAARPPRAGVARISTGRDAAASGSFEDVAGLAELAGMTPDLLAALTPHLSVWWPGAPDPALADTAVRLALTEAEEMDLAAATRPAQRVVRIEATAKVASGRTRTRRAVVRLDLGLDGRSWHMLAWDRAGT